jgi:hypothetical protein
MKKSEEAVELGMEELQNVTGGASLAADLARLRQTLHSRRGGGAPAEGLKLDPIGMVTQPVPFR